MTMFHNVIVVELEEGPRLTITRAWPTTIKVDASKLSSRT
jgi:hypothetical protein